MDDQLFPIRAGIFFELITMSRTVLRPAQPPTGAEGKAADRETTTHQQHSF
jgi:hypothetical protein